MKKFKKSGFAVTAAALTVSLSVFCSACDLDGLFGKKEPHAHNYVNYVYNNDATCTANGTETAKCSGCDETDTREAAGTKKEHSFVTYVFNDDATCTSNGTETAKCSGCDETDTREAANTKNEHNFTNYVSNGDATEESDGTKTAKCDFCDATHTVVDEGSKLPPKPVEPDNPDDPSGKPDTGTEAEIVGAEYSIHFLELGNKYTGDCTLIKCGDTEILIDAGSRKNSAVTIKNYVDKYCTDGVLEYVISTHAHQDHIAGFVGNSDGGSKTGILYQYEIGTLIQFGGTNATTNIYKEYCEAVEYAKGRGTAVYTATQCWYETDGAKKRYFLDDAETLSLNVLYNYYYDHKTNDENDYSVCMMLTDESGDRSKNYLFTGDLEEKGEEYLVRNNDLPEVELFKGGHHGSYTATTEKLLSVIKPKNVAVCCCCGTTEYTQNNDNTFPAQAFINRVAKYTENIYCTTLITDYKAGKFESMNGNIVFYYSEKLKLYCSNNDVILKDTDWFKANRVWPQS